jgi:hypothetical protein
MKNKYLVIGVLLLLVVKVSASCFGTFESQAKRHFEEYERDIDNCSQKFYAMRCKEEAGMNLDKNLDASYDQLLDCL